METGGRVWESNPKGILKTLFIDQHTHRNIVDEVPRRCLDKFFFGKRSDKFGVIDFAEFTEPDWAGNRDTMEWSGRGRRQNSTAVLGTGLFLSTAPLSRILFPIP